MKKKIVIIISAIVFLLLIALIIILCLAFNKKDNTSKEELIPYVEKEKIEITDNYNVSVPFTPYAKDTNKNITVLDGVKFETNDGTYKFHSLSITEPDKDNYVIYSFLYDAVVPVKYTVDTTKTYPSWNRSYGVLLAIFFDYYTGDLYNTKIETVSGKINVIDSNTVTSDDYAFTNVSWDNKEYKIGVRTELSSKWDGIKKVSSNNNIDSYSDTNRISVTVKIYAPKDYDGLLVALNKNGSNKDLILEELDKNNNQSVNDGNVKLLDTSYGYQKNNKDSFYVLRVDKIDRA